MMKVISAKSKCTSKRARRSNLKWSGSKSKVLAVQHLKQCEQIWTRIFSQALLSPLWPQLNVLNLEEQIKQESYWCLTRQSNNWTSCFHIGKWSVFTNQLLDPMIYRSLMKGKTDSTILGTLFLRALVSSSIDSVSHWDLRICYSRGLFA
jgi:hypothetical protein